MAAVPEPAPGDPAVYAPDGWPLQIGDRVSLEERRRLKLEFLLPWPGPVVDRSGYWSPIRARGWPETTPWSHFALNLVGDRVYAAKFEFDDERNYVYMGHFRVRFRESMRHFEPELPSEYHGKVEYYTGRPPSDPNRKIGDPPPNTLAWPDYYSGVRR
ncbi:MAG: hypothetical protein F4X67_12835 [Gemmatimonadales bacterium]|nr:hypothetical protein [Gemmatimonadales bacterium]